MTKQLNIRNKNFIKSIERKYLKGEISKDEMDMLVLQRKIYINNFSSVESWAEIVLLAEECFGNVNESTINMAIKESLQNEKR